MFIATWYFGIGTALGVIFLLYTLFASAAMLHAGEPSRYAGQIVWFGLLGMVAHIILWPIIMYTVIKQKDVTQ